jgi:hypothetical protein
MKRNAETAQIFTKPISTKSKIRLRQVLMVSNGEHLPEMDF